MVDSIEKIESFGKKSDRRTKEIELFGKKLLLSARTVADVRDLSDYLFTKEKSEDGLYVNPSVYNDIFMAALYCGLKINYNYDRLKWYNFIKKRIRKLLSMINLSTLSNDEIVRLGTIVFDLENGNIKNSDDTNKDDSLAEKKNL